MKVPEIIIKILLKKIVMRVFVAVEIENPPILDSIKKFQARFTIKAKPTSLKNVHFTLLFLGEISETQLEAVKNALNSIKFSSFEVQLVGLGVFPKLQFPRIIWIGTDKSGGEKLKKLAFQVEEKLLPIGFRNDKPFEPHLTIFRVKNKIADLSGELNKFKTTFFGVQKVTELKLKQSVLKPEGPQYNDLMVVKAKL